VLDRGIVRRLAVGVPVKQPHSSKLMGMSARDRIEMNVSMIPITGCWMWMGAIGGRGYGLITFRGRQWLAHRLAFQAFRGPLTEGKVLDHLCRSTWCVNPAHLDEVTQFENMHRGQSPPILRRQSATCRNGHGFTPENTAISWSGTGTLRHCRQCWREEWHQQKTKRKAREASAS
jgi:HNH endonuclease